MKRQIRIRSRFSLENDATLYFGDCLRLLKRIPDETVQLTITSPPYNIGKSYEGKKKSIENYIAFQSEVINEIVRITKSGGSICWQVGHHVNGHAQVIPLDILIHPLFAAHEAEHDIRLRNRIIWHFEHGLHCRRRFSGRHESILWYTKGNDFLFNLDPVRVPQKYPGKRAFKGSRIGQFSGHPLGKNPGDVWIFPNVKANHVEKTIHPCQFPIELPERLILALTRRKDIVADPFLGVGSTAIAAIINDRRGVGAEIQREYIDIARNRVQKAIRKQLDYRPRTKAVHIPPLNTSLTRLPPEFAKHRV